MNRIINLWILIDNDIIKFSINNIHISCLNRSLQNDKSLYELLWLFDLGI